MKKLVSANPKIVAGDFGHFCDIPTDYRIRLLLSLLIDSHVT